MEQSVQVDAPGVLEVLLRTYGPGLVLALIFFVVLLIAGVYLAAKNEPLAMRLAAPVVRLFAWAGRQFEYKAIEWDIEGHINTYAVKLAQQTPGVDVVAVDVEFVTDGAPPESFYRDGDLIVRLRDSGHKDENLMRAAEAYVSEILLPRSKTHMSSAQQRSLDIFVTEDLLKEQNPHAHSLYSAKVVAPAIEGHERIGQLLQQFDLIHYAGYFYPILVQELAFLAEQRVTKKEFSAFRGEVYDLIEFFGELAQREEGSDQGELSFLGNYSRCNITIVAKAEKADRGTINPWVNWVKSNAGRFDTMYLIARTRHIQLMEAVANAVEAQGLFQVFGTRAYQARTRRNGEWVVRNATVTILRNPQPIAKYMNLVGRDESAATTRAQPKLDATV